MVEQPPVKPPTQPRASQDRVRFGPWQARARNCTAARCEKPTTRLLGAGAQVHLRDPDRVQVRVAALGYCLDHKDDVVPDWVVTAAGRVLGPRAYRDGVQPVGRASGSRTRLSWPQSSLRRSLVPSAVTARSCPTTTRMLKHELP